MRDPEKAPQSAEDLHRAIIDEYHANGFNKAQAALKIRPELNYQQASNLAGLVLRSPKNQEYINRRRAEIKEQAQVDTNMILQELKSLAFSDITAFIDIDPEEVKELPPELRRALTRCTIKTKTYKDRDGKPITETTTSYAVADKMKALEMLAKYLDLFNADNQSKAARIQINNLKDSTLQDMRQILIQNKAKE